jgi:hypothetical protein
MVEELTKQEISVKQESMLHADFLLGLFFDHEDEDMLSRNVGLLSTDYAAIYRRK